MLKIIEISNDASSSITFHVRFLNVKDVRKLSYKYIKSLSRHILERKIILLSETDNLKRYLWSKFKIKAEHSFHLPCAILPNYIPKIKDTKRQKVKILFVKDRPGHDIRYALNSNKIKKKLGWYPKTNFKKGIKLTLEWYFKNKQYFKSLKKDDIIKRLGKL